MLLYLTKQLALLEGAFRVFQYLTLRAILAALTALGMAALLASCGGGGGGNDCSNGQNVFTNLSYPGSFDVYHVVVGTAVTPILAATDGIPACTVGTVSTAARALDGFEQGAKGVDGGAVRLVGSYRD